METKFIHRISKGASFNQIYIPKSAENLFKAGALVEVRLIETPLIYSKNLKLTDFKKRLIQDILNSLQEFEEIIQASIMGSFLTNNADYNDIDIVLISKKDISEKVYSFLTEKFSLKFHIISLQREQFNKLIKSDPLTRSMFYYYASTSEITLPKKEIDKTHLNFLLMLPEDLLSLKTLSKTYYDSLRRLIAIERFLKNKDADPLKTLAELKSLLGEELFAQLKNKEQIENKELDKIKKLISNKLKNVRSLLNE